MVFSLLPVQAAAADNCLKVSGNTAKVGDTITVTYTVPKKVEEIASVSAKINFDSASVQLTSVIFPTIGVIGSVSPTVDEANNASEIAVSWTDHNAAMIVDANTVLITAEFVIRSTATGILTFTVNEIAFSKADGTELDNSTIGIDNNPATVSVVSTLSGTQSITMNTRPASGAATSTVAASGTHFTVSFSEWKQGGTDVTSFASNTEYTAKGTLTASPGYQFATDADVSLSAAETGETVTRDSVSVDGSKLYFKYQYTTPALPAYVGSAASAPTLNTKSGGNVTLNAVTVTSETVEYGWSNSDVKTTADHWQDSTNFTNLAVGDYYFFARVKAKAGSHSGGGVSDASAKITVYAKPQITGYGSLDSLVIGTAVNVSPTVNVPAGLPTSNPYSITGTLPTGLSFSQSDGKISGTPTTYSADGGSVMITVTDTEGITSESYTLAFSAVAKKANTLTVTQGDVEYGTAVNPSAPSNGNTPTIMYKVQGAEDSTYSATEPTAVGAYTVKATSTGDATVADATVTANFRITPKELTNVSVSGITVTKEYDGTDSAATPSGAVTFDGKVGSDDISIKAAAGTYADKNVSTGKTVTLTLSLDGTAKGNYTLSTTSVNITNAAITAKNIAKTGATATATLLKSGTDFDDPVINGVNGETVTGTYSYSYSGKTTKSDVVNALKGQVAGNYAVGFTFNPNDPNYTGVVSGTVTVTVQDKTNAGVTISSVPTGKTYGDTEFTLTATKTAPDGGTWSWASSNDNILKIVSGGNTATATVQVLKADTTGATLTVTYDSATHYGTFTTASIPVAKKAVTVAPKAVSITKGSAIPTFELVYTGLVSGESLTPSAAPTFTCYETGTTTPVSTSTAAGSYTITWTNEGTTTFTDAGNYDVTKTATANLTISNPPVTPPSGGSSSGGGSSSSDRDTSGGGTVKTETTKNDDGSTTRTETKKDGTVIETTTGKDGSVSKTETKTETKKDGTKVETRAETVTNKDGSKSTSKTEITTAKDGTVTESKSETRTGADGTKSVTKAESKTDENGVTSGTETTTTTAPNGSTGTTVTTTENGSSRTEAETTLSSKAVEEAKRNGEPVKAPVEVEAARNSDSAPTVKIELPKSAGDTKVEIPVTNVKPGTVAVIVHPDGTEEIIKDSIPTENGVQLTVSGGATVKILDNSKDFGDIQSHWAKDAIDFVSARGLVNGINPTLYSPNASATRAQLWTILARQSDAELNGGANWYEKAQNWAKDKGISDGADPNGTINRAQMVTMLWRAMGEPVVEITHSFTDIAADNYYAQAVAWAVRNGITTGVGGGRFDPNGACTRGQIAAFLMRYCSAK